MASVKLRATILLFYFLGIHFSWYVGSPWVVIRTPRTSLAVIKEDSFESSGSHRTKKQTADCSSEEWTCGDRECISADEFCDGLKNCKDGSDETEQACNGSYCPRYLFQCGYGACVNGNALCDQVADCTDGSDEKLCAFAQVHSVVKIESFVTSVSDSHVTAAPPPIYLFGLNSPNNGADQHVSSSTIYFKPSTRAPTYPSTRPTTPPRPTYLPPRTTSRRPPTTPRTHAPPPTRTTPSPPSTTRLPQNSSPPLSHPGYLYPNPTSRPTTYILPHTNTHRPHLTSGFPYPPTPRPFTPPRFPLHLTSGFTYAPPTPPFTPPRFPLDLTSGFKYPLPFPTTPPPRLQQLVQSGSQQLSMSISTDIPSELPTSDPETRKPATPPILPLFLPPKTTSLPTTRTPPSSPSQRLLPTYIPTAIPSELPTSDPEIGDSRRHMCLLPSYPVNGYYLAISGGFPGDLRSSAELSYTCDVGFKLVGDKRNQCNGDRWDFGQPVCERTFHHTDKWNNEIPDCARELAPSGLLTHEDKRTNNDSRGNYTLTDSILKLYSIYAKSLYIGLARILTITE